MKTARKLPLKDAWAIWFLLGVVMLNYPFMHIFNKSILIFGIPLPILYFFIGWPVSIFVIYLFSVYMGDISEQDAPEHELQIGSAREPE
jgi:hypothetical protein